MSVTREDVYYARTNPQALASKINSLGDTANTGDITGLTTTDKTNVVAAINEVVAAVATKAKVKVVAGAASGNVALGDTPAAVIAVLAITTATGAAAAKLLLASTTDYTVSGSNLVMVTNQAANTLVVIYK